MFHCIVLFALSNVRGLKDLVKRKALFLFGKGHKAQCLLLQETHSSEADVKFWTNMRGDKILFGHGSKGFWERLSLSEQMKEDIG